MGPTDGLAKILLFWSLLYCTCDIPTTKHLSTNMWHCGAVLLSKYTALWSVSHLCLLRKNCWHKRTLRKVLIIFKTLPSHISKVSALHNFAGVVADLRRMYNVCTSLDVGATGVSWMTSHYTSAKRAQRCEHKLTCQIFLFKTNRSRLENKWKK